MLDLQGFLRMAYQYASPYIWPLLTYSNTARSFIYTQLLPLIQPAILYALDLSSQSPAIGLVILLASIFIGFKILSFTQRMMGYVTFLLLRLSFWGVLALCVAAVWQRGLERSVRDGVAIGKVLVGKWGEEYQKYNDGSKVAGHRAGGGMGGGKGRWS